MPPGLSTRSRRHHPHPTRHVITLRRTIIFLACLCALVAARQIVLYAFNQSDDDKDSSAKHVVKAGQEAANQVDLSSVFDGVEAAGVGGGELGAGTVPEYCMHR